MLVRHLLLIVCSFLFSVSYSQQLSFENIGTKNGLPASEVYKLFQDKQGYIWVFTEYGIVKYDGSRFIPVCTNLSLEESAAYGLAESPSGNLYFINSKAKIYRIYKDRAYKIKQIEWATKEIKRIGTYPTGLFFDDKGTLIFSSQIKTYRFPLSSYSVEHLPQEKWKPYPKVKLYIERKRNSKLDYKFGGMITDFYGGKIVQSDSKKTYDWLNGTLINVSTYAHSVVDYSGERLYVGCFHDLIYKRKNHPEKRVRSELDIFALRIAQNGQVWVGRVDGLYVYDSELNLIEKHISGVPVSNILFDDQNGVWISTIGEGIYHCRNINKRYYSNAFGSNAKISMLKIANGKLFVGTMEGKLYVKDGGLFREITSHNQKTPVNDVEYCNGRIYVAMNSGLHVCDEKLQSFRPAIVQFVATFYAIRTIASKKLLIVNGQSIGKFDVERRKLELDIRPGHCRESIEYTKGEYLILTHEGICRYKNGKYDFPQEYEKLKGINLNRMRLDQQRDLWFCSREKGLFQVDKKGKITNITGLPSLITKDILFLTDGTVILATNKGVFYNKTSTITKKESWKQILDEEMGSLLEHEGTLYFGTRNGLITIDTEHIQVGRKCQFYLQKVRSGKSKLNFSNGLNLNYNQNDLYFNFDVLDFFSRSRILEYKLAGPTQLNGRVNGTEVHLQNLDPGNYKLAVMLRTEYELGQPPTKVIHFTIHPAFWQTGTFQIIIGLVIIAVVLVVFWLFIRRKNKRQRARFEIEKTLNEYRLVALKSQVNPHFMSNSLVAIQNLILQNDIDNANLYIAKFSLLLRSLLEYSNKSSTSLNNELMMIELYVELEQLRFSNKFTFVMTIDENIDKSELLIPALITQPFIENAIWHGLLPLDQQRNPKLELKVSMEIGVLVISIIDNGVGRNYNRDYDRQRESRGTDLIKSRVEHLNQLYRTTGGKVEIIDLFDENLQSAGTHVKIFLPETILNELNHG